MNMKIFKYLLFSFMFVGNGFFAADAKSKEDTSKEDYIAFTVNGKAIRNSEIEKVFAQAVPVQERAKMTEEQIANYKKYISNMLIANILFREEAEKIHIDRDKEFRKAMQKYRETLLVTFYIQKILKDRIQQGNVMAKISALEPEFQKKKEKKVCFIVCKDEVNAKKAIGYIKEGKDFVATAKLYSALPTEESKEQAAKGAYMPVMDKIPMLPPEISTAINTLKKGEYTKEPVKAGSDYYIIKVEDERPMQVSKEMLAKIAYQQLRAEELKALINILITKATIQQLNSKGEEVQFDKTPINPEGLISG